MSALFGRELSVRLTDEDGVGLDVGRMSVHFEIDRLANSRLNTARVWIFNLSQSSIASFQRRFERMKIIAGYKGLPGDTGRSGVIFDGEIGNAFVRQEGADRVLDVFASDSGHAYSNTILNLTMSEGATLHAALRTIVGQMEGVDLGPLSRISDAPLVGPQHFSERATSALDALAVEHGFEWSIQNGVMEFVPEGQAVGASIIPVSRDTGMIESPTIGIDQTLTLTTLLDHRIQPNRLIQVRSVAQQVQADPAALAIGSVRELVDFTQAPVRVLRVTHLGETRGAPWYSKVIAQPQRVAA